MIKKRLLSLLLIVNSSIPVFSQAIQTSKTFRERISTRIRPEKDDLLGMNRFGDDLHYTLDHWIGAHVWPPVSSLVILAGPALPILHPRLAQVVFGP